MKKFLFLFSFFLLAVSNLYAGEKTITISRNDVAWESANTVYNVTKGGVELVMSGGMNNPNFLLMKQHTTITVKSHNFNIKRIVFHCLDNYTNTNLDPFYWGPTTLHIQYSQTHSEYAGKLTYDYGGNSYDACWNSTFSGTTSTNGTAHVNYPDGLPAGYELMFENEGKPVRFASIDIVVEQEVGDIYELVTNNNEVVAGQNYIIVNRQNAESTEGNAFSVKQYNNSTSGNFLSTPVELLESGLRVKTTGDVLIMKLESSNDSNYPYYFKVAGGYLRTETQAYSADPESYRISRSNNVPSSNYYYFTKININSTGIQSNWGYFAQIGFKQFGFNKRIYHNNTYKQYRTYNTDWAETPNRIYLYKPAQQYKVTTEVQPEASYGTISLRDGVLVDNGTNWSQKMETVQFLVTPANGYKVKTITIQELNSSGNVVGTVDITTSAPSINGTLYTFEMPGNDVNIIVEFEEVVYHNINIVVNPSGDYGNVFLTEGYVVQNDQVKSYDGENVVFNVTPNPIDIEHEENGYHELYSVTVTYTEGGQTISYTYTDGNYNFTMPDTDVTITATFIYENGNPLYLLGSANGKEFLPYGPRFNFDSTNQEYYIDVYFKGTNEYGGNNDNAYGYFCLSWGKWTTWDEVNQQTRRAQPWDNNYLISTENPQYTLCYDDNKQNAFKIPAGIYRIKVKSYGYHNDVLSIERNYPTLSFDPTGGENAENAVQADPGTVVTLEGDLYNKIMAINPDEPAANFKYKATKTIGENTTADEPVSSTTTATTTLTEVNDGETVTELHGYNYLGWIVAGDTAYYKVIYTPLKWIEEKGTPGTKYTVGDELIIMHVIDREGQRLLWAKDQSSSVTDPYNNPTNKYATFKTPDQIDYLDETLHVQAPGWGGWDQSNWVMLRMPENEDMTKYHIYQTIQEGTLVGTYVDDQNFCINVESMTTGGDVGYVPNTFCTANFLDYNLNLNGEGNAVAQNSGKKFFFMNPKVQEVADVTLAVWDKPNIRFIMPPSGNGVNQANISGYFTINCLYNSNGDVTNDLQNGAMYAFRGVLNVAPGGSNASLRDGDEPEPPEGPDATKVVMPFDLNDQSVITAISDVMGSKVVSSVKYYNIMGVESNKPFDGVNIVVTRYSDGTISTTKVLR